MLDLFKQFFSFKKLMKDRLVTAFFYLGLVVIVVSFLGTIAAAFALLGFSFGGGIGLLLMAFFKILFLFIGLRLSCELMVTIFHINNNLSPDGGKSDTATIDVIETTKDAAARAAKNASSATKSMVDKTKSKLAERQDKSDDYPDYEDTTPRKPARKKARAKKKPVVRKSAAKKPAPKKAPARKPAARKKPAAKK